MPVGVLIHTPSFSKTFSALNLIGPLLPTTPMPKLPAKHTSGGEGIFFLFFEEGNFITVDKEIFDYSALEKLAAKGDWVIQECLENHSLLAPFGQKFASSIRVFTYLKKNGDVEVLYATMKFFIHGQYDANTKGEYLVGVNLETGNLMSTAYNEDYETFTHHPKNNDLVFKNFAIPKSKEIIE